MNIVLMHIGGERRVVPVEYICATYVSIRWGQSGIYDLNLAKNRLTARSQKAQRKGKAYWSAEDIDAVRFMVKEHIAEKEGKGKEITREALRKHEASMPSNSGIEAAK